ncbi:hypothetical protein V6N11_001461 [Hibiscus sabdariffa]|uniref:Uncharacterized protein n=1 Tax=Hibiscus sabdariffa TaxID=183260 RepID=A0ABR2S0L8_9ROSI
MVVDSKASGSRGVNIERELTRVLSYVNTGLDGVDYVYCFGESEKFLNNDGLQWVEAWVPEFSIDSRQVWLSICGNSMHAFVNVTMIWDLVVTWKNLTIRVQEDELVQTPIVEDRSEGEVSSCDSDSNMSNVCRDQGSDLEEDQQC